MDIAYERNREVKTDSMGTSLVVQCLRLHAPNARGPGSIPGEGTRSHMLQLRPSTAENKQANKKTKQCGLKKKKKNDSMDLGLSS